MPEQIIKKIKANILPQWKICFFSAILFGFVAHLYKITNWLPNWDSLVFRYDAQNMVAMGRWFLPVVCAPSSFYDLPFVAGFMAIIFHALGAICICKMFDVKKNLTAVLVGALVATFPTVTSVMMYNYVADGYAFAFLLSCIAAMLLLKEKPNYVFAVILIALSSGIYQAYITVTITLLLVGLIFELVYKNTTIKNFLVKVLKFLVAGALGMALYYIVLTLILKITGTQLLDYQGFSDAASLKGIDFAGALYTIKHSFTEYFFDFSNGINTFSILNSVIFVITLVLYLIDLIKYKLSPTKILLLLVCVVFLPVGASVLSFINSGIDYHNLMKMGFVAFYLLFVLHYEKNDYKNQKYAVLKSWFILILTSLLVFNFIVIANIGYHKLNMAYEKSYGTLVRMADRIEQTEGADACDKLLVIGALAESENYSSNLPPDLTGTTDGYILRADDEMVGQSVLCSALNDYCGKNYSFVSGEEKIGLLENSYVETAGVWPSKSSVFVVDDVIVIKLSEVTK